MISVLFWAIVVLGLLGLVASIWTTESGKTPSHQAPPVGDDLPDAEA